MLKSSRVWERRQHFSAKHSSNTHNKSNTHNTMKTNTMKTRSRCCMAAAVLFAIGYSTSLQAAVVAYWRFESDNGTAVNSGDPVVSATDITGNGRNGTAIVSLSNSTTSFYTPTPFPNPVLQTGATNLYALKYNRACPKIGTF